MAPLDCLVSQVKHKHQSTCLHFHFFVVVAYPHLLSIAFGSLPAPLKRGKRSFRVGGSTVWLRGLLGRKAQQPCRDTGQPLSGLCVLSVFAKVRPTTCRLLPRYVGSPLLAHCWLRPQVGKLWSDALRKRLMSRTRDSFLSGGCY